MLSSFVVDVVNDAIASEGLNSSAADASLLAENDTLRGKVASLSERIVELESLIRRTRAQGGRLVESTESRPSFDGRYDGNLLSLLRHGSPVSDHLLLQELGIDPVDDDGNERWQRVLAQLDHLEERGVIMASKRGWVWRG